MRNFKITLFILFIFLFGVAGLSNVSARENRTIQSVKFEPPSGESRDFYLVNGEEVEVLGEVKGDVYAFGGQINIVGKVNGDVIALAGDVIVSGEVTGNVRAIAGQVLVTGKVGRNFTAIANQIDLIGGGEVVGGVAAAANIINLDAPVGGRVAVAARDADFRNSVGNSVEIWAENVSVRKNSSINGDLKYFSNNSASIDKEASISGQLSKGSLPTINRERSFSDKLDIPMKVVGFLAAFLLGYLIIRFMPKFVDSIQDTLNKKPLKSMFTGFLLLIILPLISIVLLITVIGIPLSVINLFVYFLSIYLAKLFFSFWIGHKIKFAKNNVTRFGIGLLIFSILSEIPIFGGIFGFFVMIFGMGGFYLSLKQMLPVKNTST